MTVLFFLLGLLVGSFLNVIIIRMPRGEGFVSGRSYCPSCKHTIGWYDLLPVISFVILRGRCRNCSKAISSQYPIIELLSGFTFAFYWHEPFILIGLLCLLVIAVIDLRDFVIPDALLVILSVSALIGGVSWSQFFVALGAFFFFFVLWWVSSGAWIGFGDVKMAGALGLFFGFPDAIGVIYLAVIVGGFFGVILLVLKKATGKTKLPFGTLLGFSAIVFVIFQDYFHEIISRFYIG